MFKRYSVTTREISFTSAIFESWFTIHCYLFMVCSLKFRKTLFFNTLLYDTDYDVYNSIEADQLSKFRIIWSGILFTNMLL